MSILDDAIREHLELKRAHGADEAELKKLEDEAFGPAERPDGSSDQVDPFAEAPTEFLAAPDAGGREGGRRMPNIADLQEPPPAVPPEPASAAEAPAPEADLGESAPSPAAEVEEQPAIEHEAIAQPASEDKPASPDQLLQPDPGAPGEAAAAPPIAEQPTEMFDVEGQFEDTAESASPSDEELIDAERSEPPLAPVDPLAGIEDSGQDVEISTPNEEPADEFDEFFSDQRLSDELSQALDEPLADEPSLPSTEEALAGLPPLPSEVDDLEPPIDRTVEQPLPPEPDSAEESLPDEPRGEADAADEYTPKPGHEDVLEDTPEFLEESPEDDELWFEQRPPKDFDFDD